MALTFKKLIPDGIKSYWQFARYFRTIFSNACIGREYVGLINSKPCWHYTNLRWYNMIQNHCKECVDQRTRARNLRPEMKESRQEHQRKTELKGNPSALIGSKERAINGKRKDSAQEETLVVSATLRINVENRRALLLLQNRRQKAMSKFLRKKSPKCCSASERRSRRPNKDNINGKCTNPLRLLAFLLYVKITQRKFGEKKLSDCTKRRHKRTPQRPPNQQTPKRAGALTSPSSCRDGASHGRVEVITHSTLVFTSVGLLQVALQPRSPRAQPSTW